jgi:hypothetical protein
MTKYLKKYIKEIEGVLEINSNKTDWKKVLNNHRVTIGFMQHERLIHLLVTLAFGLAFLTMMGFSLIYQINELKIVGLLLFVLLVPYIFHYFNLENGVQKLYFLDKKIIEKIG